MVSGGTLRLLQLRHSKSILTRVLTKPSWRLVTFPSRSFILASTSLSEPVVRLLGEAKRKKNDDDEPLVIILLEKRNGGGTDGYLHERRYFLYNSNIQEIIRKKHISFVFQYFLILF